MSQLQQWNIDEQANAGMAISEPEKTPSVGGYRALAIITFLLAVGGLFIGLLGAIEGTIGGIFKPTFQGTDFLPESLLGFAYSYYASMFRDIGGFFNALFTSGDVASVLLFLLVLMLVITVVISLVLMIVALASGRCAKRCAMTAANFTFLTYGGFFLLSYYMVAATSNTFTGKMVDVSTGAIAGVTLIALIITAMARGKGLGALNTVSFLLVLATLFGLTYPGSALAQADTNYMHLGDNLFVNLTALIVAVVAIASVIISTIRLNGKKAYVFDAVRLGVLFVAVLLAVIAQIVDKSFEAMFNSANLLPVILAVAASLAAFLLSLIIAIVQASHARAEEAREASAGIGESLLPAPEYTRTVPAESGFVPTNVQPVAEQQPAPQSTVAAAPGTTVIVQSPAPQQPATPIYAVPFFAAPMTPAPQPTPAPAPAAEPVEEKTQPAPQPAPVEETPMSEFERSMAALAHGIAPETAQPASATFAPAQAPAQQSAMYQQQVPYRPAPAPTASPMYDPTPYTYDPFINTLTPREKNEFGDLFIANRYGDLGVLPPYVIGGENGDFFRKVFIYLGKFRSHISPELLGKLYDYVSKL